MTCRKIGGCLVAIGVVLTMNSAAFTQTIWAVHDGLRLERDDLSNGNKASNSVWDGSKIKLFGAKNEIVAFQVIVQAGAQGIAGLSASLPRLQQRGGQASIVYQAPTADPTDYAGRPINVFSVNYMNVSQETRASWIISGSGRPADPLGWKPEQIVPENARAGMGGFPLSVAANNNQAIWIEIYTRRDLPAGIYEGTVTVSIDGAPRAIPLELELFNFTLPDRNVVNEMFYFEDYQLTHWHGHGGLDAAYHRFAHRHRVELVDAYDLPALRAAAGRFTGADFTAGQKYEGPGEGMGNVIVPRTFYGADASWASRAKWQDANDWISYLNANIPGYITFLYMTDEPGPSDFPGIISIADTVHANPGAGKALKIFVTHGYDQALVGAIDIWCSVPGGYNIAKALEERAAGRDYWWYNGGRPRAPAFDISCPATDARAAAWASFKHGVSTHFYWHCNHWTHNSQWGGSGSRDQNIWLNPITFNNGSSYANGDGVLIYPGEEVIHADQNRGIAGPISSLRLANLRRGLQDCLYLSLARQRGKQALTDSLLQQLSPRVFSDAGSTIGFSEDGNAFENARYRLAKAIDGATAVVQGKPRLHRRTSTAGGPLSVDLRGLRAVSLTGKIVTPAATGRYVLVVSDRGAVRKVVPHIDAP